jgi:hypothetical protein
MVADMKTPALIPSLLTAALMAGCATAPPKAQLATADCAWTKPPVVKIIVNGPGLIDSLVYDGEGALRYYPQVAKRTNAMGSTVIDCADILRPESCRAARPSAEGFDVVGTKLVGSFLRVAAPIEGGDGRFDVRFVMLERATYASKRCASPPIKDMDIQV